MKIEWKNVNELSDGHGVLFIHKAMGKPVAFLSGYEWLHAKPRKVTVEILGEDHLLLKYPMLDIGKNVDEVKETIRMFIKKEGRKKAISGNEQVRIWYNS